MNIDLFSPETLETPYDSYAYLRDNDPVHLVANADPDAPPLFILTRYEDIMHVLRNQDIFPTGQSKRRSDAAQSVYDKGGWERMTPLSTNPPIHRGYRQLVDGFFRGDYLERWRPSIAASLEDILAGLEPGQSHIDYRTDVAQHLPARIITEILGFPMSDLDQLSKWSAAWVLPFSGSLTADEEIWVAEQVVEFYQHIEQRVHEKRSDPSDDIMSFLASATLPDGRALSMQEIITMVDHLFIGGNETTTFALTSGMWILLREEGLQEKLRSDRTLIPAFIEEVLRLESPTQGLYRSVTRDTELHGVAIPAGSSVHIRYAAANRDERMFANPEAVDLTRTNGRRHLAFTLGEHNCPGAGLSRLEQQMTLDAMLDRYPTLSLDASNDFTHDPGFVLRTLTRLDLVC